jgi:cytohesin
VTGQHLLAIKCLMDHGADSNVADDEHLTPLHRYISPFATARSALTRAPRNSATCLNFVEGMKVLLQYDQTQPNCTDNTGVTPLHVAAWYGHPAAAKLLLEKGASVRFVNSDGHSPLVIAHTLHHGRALLRLLVLAGADPDEASCS